MESFCRMNPEIKNSFNLLQIPFFTIEMNCQTQGSVFASMQRCAYGTVCYYYGDEGDIDIAVGGKSWSSPGGDGIQRYQALTTKRTPLLTKMSFFKFHFFYSRRKLDQFI